MVGEARLEAVESGLAPAAGERGAAVAEETGSPREAYADRPHWALGRPDDWDALPWAAPSS